MRVRAAACRADGQPGATPLAGPGPVRRVPKLPSPRSPKTIATGASGSLLANRVIRIAVRVSPPLERTPRPNYLNSTLRSPPSAVHELAGGLQRSSDKAGQSSVDLGLSAAAMLGGCPHARANLESMWTWSAPSRRSRHAICRATRKAGRLAASNRGYQLRITRQSCTFYNLNRIRANRMRRWRPVAHANDRKVEGSHLAHGNDRPLRFNRLPPIPLGSPRLRRRRLWPRLRRRQLLSEVRPEIFSRRKRDSVCAARASRACSEGRFPQQQDRWHDRPRHHRHRCRASSVDTQNRPSIDT